MALLSKLPDDPNQRDVSQWELLVTEEELRGLLSGTGEAVGFEVHLPKDTPIVNERARIVVRRMRAEHADRHRIMQEHDGDPAKIKAAVKQHTEYRFREMQMILERGGIIAEEPAPAPVTGQPETARRPWWHWR